MLPTTQAPKTLSNAVQLGREAYLRDNPEAQRADRWLKRHMPTEVAFWDFLAAAHTD